jgi:hypothetical protein
MRQRGRAPVRFSHHMVLEVRDCARAGYGTNADIAEQLASIFDERITADDVARWRREYARFNAACAAAVRQSNIIATNVVFEAVKSGDVATAFKWLERRNPAFMPKSRMDVRGGSTLDALLKERMTEDDLRADGTITDGDDE